MDIIDSHCHLDHPAFDPDRREVLERARKVGVAAMVIPGVSRTSWPKLLAIAAVDKRLHPALGLHPYFVHQHSDRDPAELELAVEKQRPVAIGEIGLDFHRPDLDRDKQQVLLEAQLIVARQFDLPVILHIRKAHDQMLRTLKKAGIRGGICHAFNGSLQQAEQYMKLDFCFGFGGIITYERSSRLRRLARELPLDRLVLETDAPDMAGVRHRHERNSPEYLPEILESLAQARGEEPEFVARQTSATVTRVLNLPS